eukprot:5518718-Amphidinium_carterae.3
MPKGARTIAPAVFQPRSTRFRFSQEPVIRMRPKVILGEGFELRSNLGRGGGAAAFESLAREDLLPAVKPRSTLSFGEQEAKQVFTKWQGIARNVHNFQRWLVLTAMIRACKSESSAFTGCNGFTSPPTCNEHACKFMASPGLKFNIRPQCA